jgi:hypothetical protein
VRQVCSARPCVTLSVQPTERKSWRLQARRRSTCHCPPEGVVVSPSPRRYCPRSWRRSWALNLITRLQPAHQTLAPVGQDRDRGDALGEAVTRTRSFPVAARSRCCRESTCSSIAQRIRPSMAAGSGARRSAVEIGLDEPRYIGVDDVARYVERRLRALKPTERAFIANRGDCAPVAFAVSSKRRMSSSSRTRRARCWPNRPRGCRQSPVGLIACDRP